jgi:hypothetical protein
MNFGTRLRTVLAVATALNTANVMSAFAEFDNPIISTIYKAISLIALVIVLSANTYYNNDYTIEGDTGTKNTRQMKELRNYVPDYVEEPEDAEVK